MLSAVVDDPTGYGRIIRNADGQVTGIVEQKDATAEQDRINEINSGVYAFDAPVLADALQQLSTDNAQGELYLTDVLGIACAAGRPVGALVRRPLARRRHQRPGAAGRVGAELNRRLLEH